MVQTNDMGTAKALNDLSMSCNNLNIMSSFMVNLFLTELHVVCCNVFV